MKLTSRLTNLLSGSILTARMQRSWHDLAILRERWHVLLCRVFFTQSPIYDIRTVLLCRRRVPIQTWWSTISKKKYERIVSWMDLDKNDTSLWVLHLHSLFCLSVTYPFWVFFPNIRDLLSRAHLQKRQTLVHTANQSQRKPLLCTSAEPGNFLEPSSTQCHTHSLSSQTPSSMQHFCATSSPYLQTSTCILISLTRLQNSSVPHVIPWLEPSSNNELCSVSHQLHATTFKKLRNRNEQMRKIWTSMLYVSACPSWFKNFLDQTCCLSWTPTRRWLETFEHSPVCDSVREWCTCHWRRTWKTLYVCICVCLCVSVSACCYFLEDVCTCRKR